MISLAVLAAGWVVVLSPGDYAILKFPPLSRHSLPSIGGRSHDIAEDTEEVDIVLGCRVLATAVKSIFYLKWGGRRAVKLLSELDVARLLSPEEAIEASAEAFKLLSTGGAEVPLRTEFIQRDPAFNAILRVSRWSCRVWSTTRYWGSN